MNYYWTGQQEERLRRMVEDGYTLRIIARALRRSTKAIQEKVKRLGLVTARGSSRRGMQSRPPKYMPAPNELAARARAIRVAKYDKLRRAPASEGHAVGLSYEECDAAFAAAGLETAQ